MDNVNESTPAKVAAPLPSIPPAMLTLLLIRHFYLPLGERTIFRMISAGTFPKADLSIGGKIRMWKRETVEAWIDSKIPA